MAKPSPFEFFEALHPGVLGPGLLALYSTTLRRDNDHSDWCYNLRHADRLCTQFRSSRRMRFGVGLQSPERALTIARKRNGRATRGRILGCDPSVTALPALWVEIPYANRGAGGAGSLPPGRRQALDLLAAVDQRPSIVLSWPGGAVAIWLLDRPWVFDLEGECAAQKATALGLLRRLRGAVAARAAEHDWDLDAGGGGACNLAAAFPVPDSPTGRSARGPRAELERFPLVAGDARYRRRDFESLPEPPSGGPPAWRGMLDRAARRAPRRIFDFGPIAGGCGWIGHCHAERATLPADELERAVELLSWCAAPGAGSLRLIGELCRGRAGADPAAALRLLAGDPPAGDPITCRRIGEPPGVVERFCSGCQHYGRIRTPVELAAPGTRACSSTSSLSPTAPEDGPENAPGARPSGPPASGERPRILITAREHEVNDQARAALGAAGVLFERGGALVEVDPAAGVVPVREARLQELLSRHCAFLTATAGGRLRAAHPPRWTTRALLARRGWPPLPASGEAGGAARNHVGAALRGGPAPAGNDATGPELLAALEPLLDTLGGTATVRQITRALAADPERFAGLAAACARLSPDLAPGHPRLPVALGYRLRGLKGRPLAGRILVEAHRLREGTAWGLVQPSFDPPPSTDPIPKEEASP